MATKTDSQALAVITPEEIEATYPVLAVSPSELQAELEETLQGEELTIASLDKIKIPAGGSLMWTIPSVEEEQEDVRTFRGVVILSHYMRTYWSTPFGAGEAGPPNCSSPDARHGFGDYGYGSEENPTGECAACPMSQWLNRDPKTPNKRSQACALNALLYVILPGMRFPVQVKLPRTSLNMKDDKGWKAYIKRMANRGTPLHTVVTEFGLVQKTVPNSSTKYAVATMKMVGKLSEEEAARARAYAESLRPHLIPNGADDSEPETVEASAVSDTQGAPTKPAF